MPFIEIDPNATRFEYALDSDDQSLTQLVDRLFNTLPINRNTHKLAIRLILLNLIKKPDNRVLISLDNNFSVTGRNNPFSVGVTAFRTVLAQMNDAGYINFETGKKLPYGGIKSSFTAQPMLRSQLDGLNPPVPSELVFLRTDDQDRNTLVDYQDTDRSSRIRQELIMHGSLLKSTQIEVRDPSGSAVLKSLNTSSISRKFIDNGEYDDQGGPLFNAGGRSYGPWSNLDEKEERAHIYINSEPTVEIDYQASSVNVIYRCLLERCFEGDPYAIEIGGQPIPRHVVKNISTMALNNDNLRSLSGAVGKKYGEYRQSSTPSKRRKLAEYEQIIQRYRIHQVLSTFLAKHIEIKHCYMKGKLIGNKIQCLESDLIFEVVNQLTQMGIPCLTVHDSIIVAIQHQDLLQHLMDTTTFPDQSLVDSFRTSITPVEHPQG